MEGVTITITQSGTTIDTLTTDANGDAETELPLGVYTVAASYPGREDIATTISLEADEAQLIIYYPDSFDGATTLTSGVYAVTSDGELVQWDSVYAWTTKCFTRGIGIRKVVESNGILYAAGTSGKLYYYDGNTQWILAATQYSSTSIADIAVLNDKIYGLTTTGILLEWNGVNAWVSVASKYYTSTLAGTLLVFNDKLYSICTDSSVSAALRTADLFEWNDTDAWVRKAVGPIYTYGVAEAPPLCEFNSKLYAGSNNKILLEWNGVDDWTVKSSGGGSPIRAMAVFNSELYMIDNSGNDPLFKWNGVDDWTAYIAALYENTYNLFVYNDNLYTADTAGYLHVWDGATTWVAVTGSPTNTTTLYSCIAVT